MRNISLKLNLLCGIEFPIKKHFDRHSYKLCMVSAPSLPPTIFHIYQISGALKSTQELYGFRIHRNKIFSMEQKFEFFRELCIPQLLYWLFHLLLELHPRRVAINYGCSPFCKNMHDILLVLPVLYAAFSQMLASTAHYITDCIHRVSFSTIR